MNRRELEERYDEMLDEAYGVISVAGMNYDTSRLLKSIDPIAYRCGKLDYFDSEVSNGNLNESDIEEL